MNTCSRCICTNLKTYGCTKDVKCDRIPEGMEMRPEYLPVRGVEE